MGFSSGAVMADYKRQAQARRMKHGEEVRRTMAKDKGGSKPGYPTPGGKGKGKGC
jgi:hypothetical protein